MSAAPRPPASVAFQGEPGAFSEEAAIRLLGPEVRRVPAPSFETLFELASSGKVDAALAPIENTLAGSVHRCYDLLQESPLAIAGEHILRIRHYLIGCRGSSFAAVRTVASHPVALAQCEGLFATHPHLRRDPADDTAASVRRVCEAGDPGRAALGSAAAARLYGGEILRRDVQDHQENYTRFLLLRPPGEEPAEGDKTTLAVQLAHEPGALHRALAPFARRGIDLLRIESRPIVGEPWRYLFYLDLAGSIRDPEVRAALAELEAAALAVRNLGCYQRAERP